MFIRSGARLLLATAGMAGLVAMPTALNAANTYVQHNLISDIPGMADLTDPGLINPWGIATSATSPFWFSDNGSGLSTLYSTAGSGSIPGLKVTVTPSAGITTARPTGIVAHSGAGFEAAAGIPSSFIFDGEDGTITAWANAADGTHALIRVNNSAAGAVYKGLAFGLNGTTPYLYAANFNSGKIDVFDAAFAPATLGSTAFADAMIPAGFAPFNIQNLGGKLYVTYAKQDAAKKFDVSGPGNGYVDVFDTSGKLLQQLVAGAQLNSPWGVAIAPAGFGDYANDLLVGNFGNGLINVFNPASGAYIATLKDAKGNNITIPGLWALQAGNGGNGGDANAIFFTAGIPGPTGQIQSHGLFGSLQAGPAIAANAVVNGASFQPNLAPNTFITIAGSNLASTTRTWQQSDFVNGALPTTLDGVSVTINGKAAYPYFISPKQLNVLTPQDTTQGPVTVQTTNNGITSGTSGITLQSVAPAFFLFKGGFVAATHANGSYIGSTTLFPNLSTPAKPGETIVLYGTGFGPTNPVTPNGSVGPAAPLPVLSTVTFGGTAATVTYAGMVSPGLYQINVVVPPSTPDGDTAVVAQIGGQSSPANAMITVQH